MSTRLTDKIDSYSLKVNIKFDENFTSSTAPTNSGTSSLPSAITYYNGGMSGITKGPFPGQKCWRYNNTSSAAGQRYGSSGGSSELLSIFTDLNPVLADRVGFTVGMWIKINTFPTTAYTSANRLINTTNATPNNLYDGFYIGYGPDPVSGKNAFDFYTGGIDTAITSDHNGNDLVAGRWYYIAMRRVVRANGTQMLMKHEIYVNGTLKTTTSEVEMLNSNFTFFWFNSLVAPGITNHDLAAYHVGTANVLDSTAIADIWKYGAPIQKVVKYYDGSAWQTSSDKKVYDGSEWIPMYANIWDGTAWQPI